MLNRHHVGQVPLKGGVEVWASHLLAGIQATVREQLLSVLTVQQDGFSLEECAHTHPTQVASLAIYSQWTKECEQALIQCRYTYCTYVHVSLGHIE